MPNPQDKNTASLFPAQKISEGMDNLFAVHKALLDNGFDITGDKLVFSKDMADPTNRKAAFDALKSNGYDITNDFEVFSTDLGYSVKKKDSSQSLATPSQSKKTDTSISEPIPYPKVEGITDFKGFTPEQQTKLNKDALQRNDKLLVDPVINHFTEVLDTQKDTPYQKIPKITYQDYITDQKAPKPLSAYLQSKGIKPSTIGESDDIDTEQPVSKQLRDLYDFKLKKVSDYYLDPTRELKDFVVTPQDDPYTVNLKNYAHQAWTNREANPILAPLLGTAKQIIGGVKRSIIDPTYGVANIISDALIGIGVPPPPKILSNESIAKGLDYIPVVGDLFNRYEDMNRNVPDLPEGTPNTFGGNVAKVANTILGGAAQLPGMMGGMEIGVGLTGGIRAGKLGLTMAGYMGGEEFLNKYNDLSKENTPVIDKLKASIAAGIEGAVQGMAMEGITNAAPYVAANVAAKGALGKEAWKTADEATKAAARDISQAKGEGWWTAKMMGFLGWGNLDLISQYMQNGYVDPYVAVGNGLFGGVVTEAGIHKAEGIDIGSEAMGKRFDHWLQATPEESKMISSIKTPIREMRQAASKMAEKVVDPKDITVEQNENGTHTISANFNLENKTQQELSSLGMGEFLTKIANVKESSDEIANYPQFFTEKTNEHLANGDITPEQHAILLKKISEDVANHDPINIKSEEIQNEIDVLNQKIAGVDAGYDIPVVKKVKIESLNKQIKEKTAQIENIVNGVPEIKPAETPAEPIKPELPKTEEEQIADIEQRRQNEFNNTQGTVLLRSSIPIIESVIAGDRVYRAGITSTANSASVSINKNFTNIAGTEVRLNESEFKEYSTLNGLLENEIITRKEYSDKMDELGRRVLERGLGENKITDHRSELITGESINEKYDNEIKALKTEQNPQIINPKPEPNGKEKTNAEADNNKKSDVSTKNANETDQKGLLNPELPKTDVVTGEQPVATSILNQENDLKGEKKNDAMLEVKRSNSVDDLKPDDIVIVKGNNQPDMEMSFRGFDNKGNAVVYSKKDGQFSVKKSEITPKDSKVIGYDNTENIAYALENGIYQKWVGEGRISQLDAETIIKSAGLEVPKELQSVGDNTTPTENRPPTELEIVKINLGFAEKDLSDAENYLIKAGGNVLAPELKYNTEKRAFNNKRIKELNAEIARLSGDGKIENKKVLNETPKEILYSIKGKDVVAEITVKNNTDMIGVEYSDGKTEYFKKDKLSDLKSHTPTEKVIEPKVEPEIFEPKQAKVKSVSDKATEQLKRDRIKKQVADSKVLREDKDRVLGELSTIRETIKEDLEVKGDFKTTQEVYDWHVSAFGTVGNLITDNVRSKLKEKGINIDEKGYVTIKTPKGEFKFPVADIASIEKAVKQDYPSNTTAGKAKSDPITSPRQRTYVNQLDKNGRYKTKEQVLSDIESQIRMHEENIAQAKKTGNTKLIETFQKEIDNLKEYHGQAKVTDFEQREIERIITEDLRDNPLMKLVSKLNEKGVKIDKIEFGKKLLALNMADYKLGKNEGIVDFNNAMDEALRIKQGYDGNKTIESVLAKHNRELNRLHDERNSITGRKSKERDRKYESVNSRIKETEDKITTLENNKPLIEQALKNEPYEYRGGKQIKIEPARDTRIIISEAQAIENKAKLDKSRTDFEESIARVDKIIDEIDNKVDEVNKFDKARQTIESLREPTKAFIESKIGVNTPKDVVKNGIGMDELVDGLFDFAKKSIDIAEGVTERAKLIKEFLDLQRENLKDYVENIEEVIQKLADKFKAEYKQEPVIEPKVTEFPPLSEAGKSGEIKESGKTFQTVADFVRTYEGIELKGIDKFANDYIENMSVDRAYDEVIRKIPDVEVAPAFQAIRGRLLEVLSDDAATKMTSGENIDALAEKIDRLGQVWSKEGTKMGQASSVNALFQKLNHLYVENRVRDAKLKAKQLKEKPIKEVAKEVVTKRKQSFEKGIDGADKKLKLIHDQVPVVKKERGQKIKEANELIQKGRDIWRNSRGQMNVITTATAEFLKGARYITEGLVKKGYYEVGRIVEEVNKLAKTHGIDFSKHQKELSEIAKEEIDKMKFGQVDKLINPEPKAKKETKETLNSKYRDLIKEVKTGDVEKLVDKFVSDLELGETEAGKLREKLLTEANKVRSEHDLSIQEKEAKKQATEDKKQAEKEQAKTDKEIADWKKKYENIPTEEEFNQSVVDDVFSLIEKNNQEPTTKVKPENISSDFKTFITDIKKIVNDNQNNKDLRKEELVKKFVSELGIDKNSAEKIYDAIKIEADKIYKKEITKLFTQKFGIIGKRVSVKGKAFEKLAGDVERGVFDENYDQFATGISEKYGLRELTTEEAKILGESIRAAKATSDGPLGEIAMFKASKIWEFLMPRDPMLIGMIKTGIGITYENMLSGPTTQFANMIPNIMNISSKGFERITNPGRWGDWYKGIKESEKRFIGDAAKRTPLYNMIETYYLYSKSVETARNIAWRILRHGGISSTKYTEGTDVKTVMSHVPNSELLRFGDLGDVHNMTRYQRIMIGKWNANPTEMLKYITRSLDAGDRSIQHIAKSDAIAQLLRWAQREDLKTNSHENENAVLNDVFSDMFYSKMSDAQREIVDQRLQEAVNKYIQNVKEFPSKPQVAEQRAFIIEGLAREKYKIDPERWNLMEEDVRKAVFRGEGGGTFTMMADLIGRWASHNLATRVFFMQFVPFTSIIGHMGDYGLDYVVGIPRSYGISITHGLSKINPNIKSGKAGERGLDGLIPESLKRQRDRGYFGLAMMTVGAALFFGNKDNEIHGSMAYDDIDNRDDAFTAKIGNFKFNYSIYPQLMLPFGFLGSLQDMKSAGIIKENQTNLNILDSENKRQAFATSMIYFDAFVKSLSVIKEQSVLSGLNNLITVGQDAIGNQTSFQKQHALGEVANPTVEPQEKDKKLPKPVKDMMSIFGKGVTGWLPTRNNLIQQGLRFFDPHKKQGLTAWDIVMNSMGTQVFTNGDALNVLGDKQTLYPGTNQVYYSKTPDPYKDFMREWKAQPKKLDPYAFYTVISADAVKQVETPKGMVNDTTWSAKKVQLDEKQFRKYVEETGKQFKMQIDVLKNATEFVKDYAPIVLNEGKPGVQTETLMQKKVGEAWNRAKLLALPAIQINNIQPIPNP